MPAITRLVEYGLLVPDVHCPADSTMQDRVDDFIAKRVISLYGGFTKYSGLRGAWCDAAGAVIYDVVSDYRIAVADSPRSLDGMRALAFQVGKDLGEQCMYLRLPGQQVELITIS